MGYEIMISKYEILPNLEDPLGEVFSIFKGKQLKKAKTPIFAKGLAHGGGCPNKSGGQGYGYSNGWGQVFGGGRHIVGDGKGRAKGCCYDK
jgi:hypothetical protein